ncbi:MAG: integrase, partial [Odoribacter sp.]
MKEKLIQEISSAMTDVLSIEQIAQLNGVLLQVVSRYTIIDDGEKTHEDAATNERLLEVFLSA